MTTSSGRDAWRRALSEHAKQQRRGRTARRDPEPGSLGYRVRPSAGDVQPGVVQVRLIGELEDIDAVAEALAGHGVEVIDRSGPRGNRYDPGVRVYLTVRVHPGSGGARSGG